MVDFLLELSDLNFFTRSHSEFKLLRQMTSDSEDEHDVDDQSHKKHEAIIDDVMKNL